MVAQGRQLVWRGYYKGEWVSVLCNAANIHRHAKLSRGRGASGWLATGRMLCTSQCGDGMSKATSLMLPYPTSQAVKMDSHMYSCLCSRLTPSHQASR